MTSLAGTRDDIVAGVPTGLYIGGAWRPATGAGTLEVEDPGTGEPLAEIADATAADAVAALDAACGVADEWAAWAPRARGEILGRAFDELMARREELALLMTLEMGKPLAESRGEIAYAAEYFRWFAEEAVRIGGRYATAPDGRSRLLVTKQPVGPCLLVTPWNFPMAMGTRKIGPAVAAGCTMVVKPAKQTPLSMLALADILERAGLPGGVLNVVTSASAARVVEPLITDPRMRKLSFTGSTETGRLLVEQSATRLLRMSMELGGNAPFVVFEDADLDRAVEGAMLAKMRNGGEACTAANRFLVHEAIAAEFTRRLAERMGALQVGHGADDGTDVGPLIDGREREKVATLVEDARSLGADVLCGGESPDGPGYFYPPTVLAGVPEGARVLGEEIFGPVAPVQTFADEDRAVALANDTEHGLVAYLFAQDIDRALRVGGRIETGMLGLNQGIVSNPAAPFGGVKASGFGREGGSEGIEEYLAMKYFAIAVR